MQAGANVSGLVLAVVEVAPLHGYGIAREIEKRSADALSFGEGTLYPVLKTLEKSGLIEGKWDTAVERGPARKVYEITHEGKMELGRIRDAWSEYSRSVDLVLGQKETHVKPRTATSS